MHTPSFAAHWIFNKFLSYLSIFYTMAHFPHVQPYRLLPSVSIQKNGPFYTHIGFSHLSVFRRMVHFPPIQASPICQYSEEWPILRPLAYRLLPFVSIQTNGPFYTHTGFSHLSVFWRMVHFTPIQASLICQYSEWRMVHFTPTRASPICQYSEEWSILHPYRLLSSVSIQTNGPFYTHTGFSHLSVFWRMVMTDRHTGRHTGRKCTLRHE